MCPIQNLSVVIFPREVRFAWRGIQYKAPEGLEPHRQSLIDHHKTRSKVFDNEMLRVDSISENDDGCLTIYLCPTTYFDTLITNRSLGVELPSGQTVRELLVPEGEGFDPFAISPLSNHLGATVMVQVEDSIAFVQRNALVSTGKNTLGASVTGSVKGKYALDDNGVLRPDGVKKAVEEEVLDEAGFSVVFEDDWIKAVFFDLEEGNKPNLYAEIEFPGTKEEYVSVFTGNPAPDTDGDDVIFLEVDELEASDIDGQYLVTRDNCYKLSTTTAEAMEIWLELNSK